ncbi:MAG: ABC transporter substrate-binding protein [Candidatus Binatia bacterium]
MKRFFFSLLLACFTLTLAALAQAQTPKPGGTLVFGLERQLSTFNPFIRAGGVDLDVRTLIYEGLLDKDTKGNIVPALAETWTVSKDGLVYNFKLRRGVKFHNGKELTSADVKWTVDYAMNPKNGAEGLSYLRGVRNVRVPDPLTIEFTLSEPKPIFLAYLALLRPFMIVPAGSVPSVSEKIDAFPPGTGPFVFKEARSLGHVVLARNPSYWQKGLPYLDQVVFRTSEDPTVRFTNLRAGDLDLIERAPYVFVRKIESGDHSNLRATAAPYAGFRRLIFNVAEPPFDSLKFRQAVAFAIDRKEYLEAAFWGYGTPTQQRFPGDSPWHTKFPDRERDVAKVKSLLKEAGAGADFQVELLGRRGTESEYQIIQRQLETAGIKVKVLLLEGAAFRERQRRGNYQLGLFGGDYPDDPADTYPPEYACDEEALKAKKRTRNWPGYCNREVDRLLAQAAAAPDLKKRQELYGKVTRILFDEVPDISLAYVPRFFTYHEKVKGFTTDADGRFSAGTFGVTKTWIDR